MNNEPVFRSLEIIENRISEKLTVENIASSVYFSKYHYGRLFREIVGESVMEYVTKRKLTLAGSELLETNATILDIALRFGYDSHEGFTRSFKAYMGVTPTEYRKYGLAVISQKTVTVKEKSIMMYSKTTNEIVRELNDFIAKAKGTAETARKCELPWYKEFWCSIADRTDVLTNSIEQELIRISDIADHPDEITNGFNILKIIDDTAFILHVMAFHVKVTASRAKPNDLLVMKPICEKYQELGNLLDIKAHKIMRFLNELSALIIEDMRKTFAKKMEDVVLKAKNAADMIEGYGYIKCEIAHIADELAAMSIEEITAMRLNDNLFKLPFLQIAIDTDIMRSGGKDKAMFAGIEPLKQGLEESLDFIKSLPKPKIEEPLVVRVAKTLDDIGYHGNILLFYTRGEIEKLGDLLDKNQKAITDKICERINHYIHFTQSSADQTAFKPIADRIQIIKEELEALADGLGEYGGAIRVIYDEFGNLYNRVTECIKSVEAN